MDVLEGPSCQTCSCLCSFGFQKPLSWHLWQHAGSSAPGCAGSAGLMWFWLFPFPWELFISGSRCSHSGSLCLVGSRCCRWLQCQMEHGQLLVLGWGWCCIADPWSQPCLGPLTRLPAQGGFWCYLHKGLCSVCCWGCGAGVCPWIKEML